MELYFKKALNNLVEFKYTKSSILQLNEDIETVILHYKLGKNYFLTQ